MIEYFTMQELPGQQFFRCQPYSANLSATACANNWRQANHHNNESRIRCKLCPVGAMHAGESDASTSSLKGSHICARCNRGATRLIGKNICVSCYNRQREFLTGKNAKGTKPIRITPLAPRRIKFAAPGNDVRLVYSPLTSDTEELVVQVLRDSNKQVRFGFYGAVRGQAKQGRLF